MTTIVAKQDRIGARVPHEVHELLRRAADLTGATVNQFLVNAALKEAHSVIEREERIRLSPQGWNWLLDLTENPGQANPKLKAALAKYQHNHQADADRTAKR